MFQFSIDSCKSQLIPNEKKNQLIPNTKKSINSKYKIIQCFWH